MYFHSHTSYLLSESVSMFNLSKFADLKNTKMSENVVQASPKLDSNHLCGSTPSKCPTTSDQGPPPSPLWPQPLLPTNPPFQPPTPSLPLPANYEFPTGISWQRWARDPNPARGKVAKTKKIWPTSHVVHIGIITTTIHPVIFIGPESDHWECLSVTP